MYIHMCVCGVWVWCVCMYGVWVVWCMVCVVCVCYVHVCGICCVWGVCSVFMCVVYGVCVVCVCDVHMRVVCVPVYVFVCASMHAHTCPTSRVAILNVIPLTHTRSLHWPVPHQLA